MSEALSLELVNPQYDERLFIEKIQVQKTFLNLYLLGNSMNNLFSYCGLTDARMRASKKDLPVPQSDKKSVQLVRGSLRKK